MEENDFDLNELGGLSIEGHTYSKLKHVYDIYICEKGLLGYEGKLIEWDIIKKIYLLGQKRGWI